MPSGYVAVLVALAITYMGAHAPASPFEELVACYAHALEVDKEFDVVVSYDPAEGAAANVYVDLTYLRAYIDFDTTHMFAQGDAYTRMTIVHELFHVLAWRMGSLAAKANHSEAVMLRENLAVRVQRMPLWLALCHDDEEG